MLPAASMWGKRAYAVALLIFGLQPLKLRSPPTSLTRWSNSCSGHLLQKTPLEAYYGAD